MISNTKGIVLGYQTKLFCMFVWFIQTLQFLSQTLCNLYFISKILA